MSIILLFSPLTQNQCCLVFSPWDAVSQRPCTSPVSKDERTTLNGLGWGGGRELGGGRIIVWSDLGCSSIPVQSLTQITNLNMLLAISVSHNFFWQRTVYLFLSEIVGTFFLKRKDEKGFLSKQD